MISLQLEVDEKGKQCDLLKQAFQTHKEQSQTQLEAMQKDLKKQLQLQRQQYEVIVKRQLGLLDKALQDKQQLSRALNRNGSNAWNNTLGC
ncbi:hypothetical protein HMI56_006132 [Coelomomyces lativittatus]|nr:hypothetical protein HMI56_006132 [Coelomomyces lativittatus]